MKKLMLKRTGSILVLIVFIFTTIVSMAGLKLEANAASDFVLTHSNTDALSQGDYFQLPLRIRNLSGENLKIVELDFSSAGIAALTNGATILPVGADVAEDAVDVLIATANMRFTGTGSSNTMQVIVKYIVGAGTEQSATVSLTLNTASQDPSPSPIDTTKFKPVFQASVVGSDDVVAGSSNSVRISLKNISTNTSARNLVYVPVFDKNSPFVTSKAITQMPITDVAYGNSTEIAISIDVDKFAQPGVHPFTFKLTYMNAWNNEFTSEHTVYLDIANYQTNASFNVQFPEGQSVSAVAGGTFDLPIVLVNNGTLSARNVKVTLSGLSQDTFMLSSGTGRNDFYKILGNERKSLTYTLKTAASLKSGSYPITFDLSYLDEKGTEITEKLQLWIPVTGSEGAVSALEILEIKPSKTNVKSGETFEVSVKVKNSGNHDASQIKVSADGGTTLLPVSQNLFIVPTLKKGETRDIIFRFQPSPEAPRGGVPITIKVESVDGGQNATIAQAISVFIDSEGKAEAGKNIPKIIVKTYSSEPTLVKAGERFTLNLQFLNTHASRTVRNIKGSFIVTESSNETGNVFSPVDSSNTFYIDEIAPKGTCDWTLNLYTIPDAKSKTYTVTISFEYEDDTGATLKADELIGIPVYQPSRFEVSEFSLPTDSPMGQPLYLAFEMYNMGKTDIYNVKLTVEGDFDAQPKSNYFGNFESGRREYFELNLIPMMVGQSKGRLIFQYETASGEVNEVVKEISMNVFEMMPMDPGFPVDGGKPLPGMEEPQKKGFVGSVWFYIAIGAVVVAVVLTIILVRRKRKKDKEFEF